MFPSDQCIVNGRPVSMPRYYVKQLSEEEAKGYFASAPRQVTGL